MNREKSGTRKSQLSLLALYRTGHDINGIIHGSVLFSAAQTGRRLVRFLHIQEGAGFFPIPSPSESRLG